MEHLGTKNLWSKYSLKGKKGKEALADLPLYSALISKYITLSAAMCWSKVLESSKAKGNYISIIFGKFVIPEACMCAHKTSRKIIEEMLTDFLKYAPYQRGGPKYKVSQICHNIKKVFVYLTCSVLLVCLFVCLFSGKC